MDDWDLLEQFRLARSEQAFGELVRRHAGFVLATCRRRLRDPHLSEDAAQAVFLVLARRPPTRSGSSALAGWLYKTAVYACNNAMRAKRSRDQYERQAAAERAATVDPRLDVAVDPAETERLLDEALAELSSKERDAVLLRYYQDQSVQQVGQTLGISQNTATKRIGRAIERMREFLADKGLAISAPALIEAFTHATRAPMPPPEFIAQATSVAMGQSVASVVVQHLAEGVNHMIRIAKAKLVAAVVAVVLTAGGGIVTVNQLWAQSNASKPAAVVASNESATPKATLHALAAAARAADVEGMKKLVDIKNPSEQQLLLAACEYAGARKALLEAVNAKFGEPAMTRLGGRMLQINLFDVLLNDLETHTDQRTEKTHGNEAILTATEGEFSDIRMVRDDAGWKLSATGMTKDWPQEKYTEVLTGVQQGSAALGDLTNGINDGKFATFADLAKTVRGMMRGR
jgi:RNA polymerase sigma factor (sigma-70 family)